MDFIQTANKQVDKFGVGKHGFSAGNPGGGVLATLLSNLWCDGVQQELISVIEAAGLVATGATLTQVRQAIKRMCGGNVRTITAAGPTVLTADDAGMVVIDATANAVAITLPAVNAVTGVPLMFEFVRVDTTANAVTITRAGADTFVGGATSFTLNRQGDQRTLAGDATSKWATVAMPEGLGTNQAVQNVLGSRASSTTYTNSTGRPIFVWISANLSGGAAALASFVSGQAVANLALAIGQTGSVCLVVPHGQTYSITLNTGTLSSWMELR